MPSTDDRDAFDVLVTGSSGHLGSAFMMSLPDLGFTPLGIDIVASATTNLILDIADSISVRKIFVDYPNIRHILHGATLHKPHVGTHTKQEFIDTNISGTLVLLEAAAGTRQESNNGNPRVESFVFFSTTSTFGNALAPRAGQPAAWINESVVPQPKNIYGVTKVAAEDMCLLVHKQTGLPVIVLRVSRFFPEEDDLEDSRVAMADENLKVLELAYRRCDIEDIVAAGVCAMKRAPNIQWAKYIISAPPPFSNDPDTLALLDATPARVFDKMVPHVSNVFERQGWKFLPRVDRVYDSSRAIEELGWQPKYTFENAIEAIQDGKSWKSALTDKVGKRGYHSYAVGVYTTK